VRERERERAIVKLRRELERKRVLRESVLLYSKVDKKRDTETEREREYIITHTNTHTQVGRQ
jgi:hypothetical protein